MERNRIVGAPLAVLAALSLLALAYLLGRGGSGITPEAVREVVGERLASLDEIGARLDRLEAEVEAARSGPPADGAGPEGAAPLDADRWAAVESGLTALAERLKGLEEDPVRRGESFLASENAEMRREGINILRRVARFDPATRAAIRALLHDPSSRVREQAAQTLRDLRDKESAPELKALLLDADARTRRRAVEALAAADAREAAREIGVVLLSDSDDAVRIAAADALGKLKAQEAAGALSEALKDRNEAVRGEAIASLGEVGATAASGQLRAIYDQEPGSHRLRLALALRSLGDEAPLQREVSRLSEIVKSETDERARRQAQRDLALLTRRPPQ